MRKTALDQFKNRLKPGQVYRRAELSHLSSSIDRHLKQLVESGNLKKLQTGLYVCPRHSTFGETPPDEDSLIETFLRSNQFLVYSPNLFNSLELGTTQLYNRRVVLNQKRHGEFTLGGRSYVFQRRLRVPRKLTREVLLVEMLNQLKNLAEDRESILAKLSKKLSSFDHNLLSRAARQFGTYSTRKQIRELLKDTAKIF